MNSVSPLLRWLFYVREIDDADFLLQIFKDWREYEQIHIMFWVGYEQPRFLSILGMRNTFSFPEYLFRHCVPRADPFAVQIPVAISWPSGRIWRGIGSSRGCGLVS
jgi:hypothetical protein